MELKVGDSIIIFNGEQRKINHIFKTDNKIAYGIDKEFLIDYSDGGWGRNYVFKEEIKYKIEYVKIGE